MISEHFKRSEFACRCGCGYDTVDYELLLLLEKIRNHFNYPLIITSAARCTEHNKAVGGRSNSQHLIGKAADIVVLGHTTAEVASYTEGLLPYKGGLGRYKDFTHVDVRDEVARWIQ